MGNSGKKFNNNPAEMFFTSASKPDAKEDINEHEINTNTSYKKINTQKTIKKTMEQANKGEKRTYKTTILLYPSVAEKAEKLKTMKKGASLNDLIDEGLNIIFERDARLLKQYDEVFGNE